MSANVEGNNAFYVGEPAWHKQGVTLTDAPSPEQAWRLAYPHDLVELPIFPKIGDTIGDTAIPDKKAIFRDDGKYIGTVGIDYCLVQPQERFGLFEPLINTGLVELETGMSLAEGTRIAVLAKIKSSEMEVIKNDTIKAYVLMYGSFDGSLKFGVKNCATRVVCCNTLAMAIGEHSDLDWSFKHTKNVVTKVKDAVQTVQQAIQNHKSAVEQYRVLAKKRATVQQLETYVYNVLAMPDPATNEISKRNENTIQSVIDRLDTQRGMELVPAARGTYWQGYNAVTEYITHDYGRNQDNRLNAQWFGVSADLNQKALQLALAA